MIRVVSVRTRTKAGEDTPTTLRGKEAKHFLTTSSTSRAAGRNVTPGVSTTWIFSSLLFVLDTSKTEGF